MPEMIVWPVSSLTLYANVGSSRASSRRVSASFPLSAELTGSIDMLMTVSGNSIRSSRIGCEASQSVSPVTESFRPTTPTMSPARRFLDLLAFVGADVIEPRAVLLLVLARVVDARLPGLELSRVDPDEREVAVGVVGDLEDQAAERLVGAGLAGELGSLFGVVADDRRPVERAGQVGGDGVEQPLDADVLEARAAQDRLGLAGQRGAPQGGDDLGLGAVRPLRGGPCRPR